MSAPKNGGSAFPVQGLSGLPNGDVVWPEGGMTLRAYIANQALAALIGHPNREPTGANSVPLLARYAVEYADALLEALGEGQ